SPRVPDSCPTRRSSDLLHQRGRFEVSSPNWAQGSVAMRRRKRFSHAEGLVLECAVVSSKGRGSSASNQSRGENESNELLHWESRSEEHTSELQSRENLV